MRGLCDAQAPHFQDFWCIITPASLRLAFLWTEKCNA